MTPILNIFSIAWRQARRFVVLVVGLLVLAIGVALLVLPGPAFVVIPMGLGILSIEFVWARVWLTKIRTSAEAAADRLRQMNKPKTVSAVPAEKSGHSLGVRLR